MPSDKPTVGLLVLPYVWYWYFTLRKAKRSFYMQKEANMLTFGFALMRRETGYLRQRPTVAFDLPH